MDAPLAIAYVTVLQTRCSSWHPVNSFKYWTAILDSLQATALALFVCNHELFNWASYWAVYDFSAL